MRTQGDYEESALPTHPMYNPQDFIYEGRKAAVPGPSDTSKAMYSLDLTDEYRY